jgi:ribosomal-protein-alanine acetyltransferase
MTVPAVMPMDLGSWTIRRGTPTDLDGIMKIESSVFANDAWSPVTMQLELRSEHTVYLVVARNDDPTVIDGYAGLFAPIGASDADIQTIAIVPTARRQGLAKALMLALEADARERGATQLFLEVREDNPDAQVLYRGLGFEQIGSRPHYYQPDDVTALVMRLKLGASEVL